MIADMTHRGDVLAEPPGNTVLRDEREKRGLSRKQLAEMAEISEAWIRDIETKGENPGKDLRERIRRALEKCPVHMAFGVECDHKLPVPADEELYASMAKAEAEG
jgi:transcriptional regulator with XRE-family HTH domain